MAVTNTNKEINPIQLKEILTSLIDAQNKQLLSIEEAGEYSGIGTQRIRELARVDRTFPAIQVGTHKKIHRALFSEWLEQAVKDGRSL